VFLYGGQSCLFCCSHDLASFVIAVLALRRRGSAQQRGCFLQPLMRRCAATEYLGTTHQKHHRSQEKKDDRNQTKIIDERHQ
jgi:hypothetical protein